MYPRSKANYMIDVFNAYFFCRIYFEQFRPVNINHRILMKIIGIFIKISRLFDANIILQLQDPKYTISINQ